MKMRSNAMTLAAKSIAIVSVLALLSGCASGSEAAMPNGGVDLTLPHEGTKITMNDGTVLTATADGRWNIEIPGTFPVVSHNQLVFDDPRPFMLNLKASSNSWDWSFSPPTMIYK